MNRTRLARLFESDALRALLVYAGAVVVLFVFVIMLIGPSAVAPPGRRAVWLRRGSAALMLLFTAVIAFLLAQQVVEWPKIAPCPPGAGAECGHW